MGQLGHAFDSISNLATQIHEGTLSPVALVEELLGRIDAIDPQLHSFLRITGERARAEARAAEIALKGGQDLGPLHGIPYAVKDLFDVKGVPTTAGTHLLDHNLASADSTAVRKLSAAGMSLLGKNHTIQLAFGLVGINNDQGTPHNPWHEAPHAPGGSSSGSAVAVAAGLTPVSLGTDTGGSVRVPAALCGIVGLKTTVGRIGRAGVYPLSWTLDSVGVLARTVEDAAQVYEALQGPDARDATTTSLAAHDALRGLKDGVRGLRIAFGETLFFDDVDPQIEKAVRSAGDVFRSLGAQVQSVAVPEAAEVWAEEKRPLFIASEGCVVNRKLLDKHFDALDPTVAPRMITGRTLSASDYFALSRRFAELRESVAWTLRDVDAVLVPTTMAAARPLATVNAAPRVFREYSIQLGRNAGLGNILNLCGVSVPCGFHSDGLPMGLMIYAKPFHEDMALRVGYAYEQATEWHTRRPEPARAAQRSGSGARAAP